MVPVPSQTSSPFRVGGRTGSCSSCRYSLLIIRSRGICHPPARNIPIHDMIEMCPPAKRTALKSQTQRGSHRISARQNSPSAFSRCEGVVNRVHAARAGASLGCILERFGGNLVAL